MRNKNIGQDRAALETLWSLYINNKSTFLVADLLRVTSSIAAAFLPYFIARIVTTSGDNSLLFKLLLSFFLVMVLHGFLWALADFAMAGRVNKKFYEFREIMFETTWKKRYQDFISTPSGKTAATITRIHSGVLGLYETYNWEILRLVASLPVFVFLLLDVVLENIFIYIVFLVVVLVILKFQVISIRKKQRIFADADTTADGNIFDSISNFVNVISFGARTKELKAFRTYNADVKDASVKAQRSIVSFWASSSMMLRVILWGVILGLNFYLYDNGSITFEQFVLSVTVLMEFTREFWGLVGAYGHVAKDIANYKENYTYLFGNNNVYKQYQDNYVNDIDLVFESENVEIPDFNKSIKISNLNFAYPDQPEIDVLDNISLEISKGEKIGVVGKSGSGKTSLVKILLGFYDYDDSTIFVDNISVSKDQLAKMNCYVPQDTALFQQTISYNIAYARNDDVTPDEIIEAATKAHAHEFISNLKNGYETLVGERGIKLSLGQRQRIAIARAFLKKSDLLILDEATSALDSKTESMVQESLEKLWENRTVIAVAHRLSTLNNVDRIIVMDKGRIVEQGTKTELLQINGYFAELWKHQRDGMLLDDEDQDQILNV